MKNLIYRDRKALSILILLCLCFTYNYAQTNKANSGDALPVSTPEAEGVSLAGILKFRNAVDKGKNELHGFIVRHGKIISEGWWGPF